MIEIFHFKILNCNKCFKRTTRLNQDRQLVKCFDNCLQKARLQCNSCKILITKAEDVDVSKVVVTCLSCEYGTVISEMENHYNQCQKIEIDCQACGLSILRLEFGDHKEKKCHIRWELWCPFGCNTYGFSETELEEHRKNQFLYHLDILISTICHFGLDNILKLRTDVAEGGPKKEIKNFKCYKDICNDVSNDISEYRSLTKEVDDLKRKLRLKRLEKKEQMRLLERSISVTLLTSYDGRLVWIMDDCDQSSSIIKSPIFYTGKYGYKLQLLLKKNGENRNLVLIFLPWAYDPILPKAFDTISTLSYKLKEEPKKETVLEKITCDRSKEEILIENNFGQEAFEWIRLEINCSDFDISSVD